MTNSTPSIAVVTATVGRNELISCRKSVEITQGFDVQHYVFGHGYAQSGKARTILDDNNLWSRCHLIELPHNNGANGYGCSGVYAAAPYIVKEDMIFYLDDDNTFDPMHIPTIVTLMQEHKLEWAYSLRQIIDHDGNHICHDDCESLGMQPNATGHTFVDQSCYAIRRETARQMANAWYYPICSDRNVFANLTLRYRPFGTTGLHTVNYRLSKDGSGGMSKDAFLNNNKVMGDRHSVFTWRQQAVFK